MYRDPGEDKDAKHAYSLSIKKLAKTEYVISDERVPMKVFNERSPGRRKFTL